MLSPQSSSACRITITDGSLSFSATAASEAQAIVEALDKIGFTIQPSTNTPNTYEICDVEDHSVECVFTPTNPTDVLYEALALVGWAIVDSQDLVGDAVGNGYHVASPED